CNHRGIRVERSIPCFGNLLGHQPPPGGLGIGADEEYLLHGAGAGVEALEAGLGGVLDLEAGRRLAPADLDPAGHNARDVRAMLDDVIEDRIEPPNPSVLPLDAPELHPDQHTATTVIEPRRRKPGLYFTSRRIAFAPAA